MRHGRQPASGLDCHDYVVCDFFALLFPGHQSVTFSRLSVYQAAFVRL
jgi:hypothetical protein